MTVREGSPDGPVVAEESDGLIELYGPAAGEYYVEVRRTAGGGCSFVLLADPRPVQDIASGEEVSDQLLAGHGDARWYRLEVEESVFVLRVIADCGRIIVRAGSPSGPIVGQSDSGVVEVFAPTAGEYYVEIRATASGSCTFSLRTEVVAGETPVVGRLHAPDLVRASRGYVCWLEYMNLSYEDQPAPLFVVSSGEAPMRLSAHEPYTTGSIQVLGINLDGPADTLPPHVLYRIPIHFRSPALGQEARFDLEQMVADETPVDWGAIEVEVRPDDIDPDGWAAIWANLTAQMGPTWADYLQTLGDNATYLREHGSQTYDVRQLWAFQIAKASGALSPRRTLAGAVDAYSPARVLPLAFVRVAPVSLDQRFRLGPLGRGWSHNFEYSLSRPEQSRVIITGPAGSVRTFSSYAGTGWQGEPGEYGTLAENGDGSYSLREKDGLVLSFDSAGVLTSIGEPNGNSLTPSYDGLERLVTVVHSNGETLSLTYDGSGRVSQLTDHAGRVTHYYYDGAGEHLVSVVSPGGATTSYAYDSAAGATEHSLTTIAYPDGTHRYYSYDPLGRLVEQWRDDGAEWVGSSYDSFGTVEVTDAAVATATIHVGVFGEPLEAQDPLGNAVAFGYDERLNLVQLTGPDGGVTDIAYDRRGMPLSILDPMGQVTSLGHTTDYAGLDWLRDAHGNLTDFAADENGNLTAVTYPDGTDESFTYDGTGDLVAFTNRRGQTVNYAYDAFGRVTWKQYPDGRNVTYTYDGRGNLTGAVDSVTGAIAMTYDMRDFLTLIEYPDGKWFAFEYNDAGRRTRRTGHDGYVLDHYYDAVGRLALIADGEGTGVVSYDYDSTGRLSLETKGNGTYTTYDYDAAGQLTLMVNYSPADEVQSYFEYTYDVNGNRTSMTTLAGTTACEYDGIGQLVGVAYPNGRYVTYEYDAVGNRVTVTEDGVATNYVTNNMNQYTSVGGTTYGYDADGNMTSKTDTTGTTTYDYDAENRLVRVLTPADGTWEYTYDALGNRIAVTHDGVTTWYLHDPIGLVDVVAEYDDVGELVARYDYGLGLVARVDAVGSPAYYSYDALGHTRQLTDDAGFVVNSYAYDPFGVILHASETVANLFRYVGRSGVLDGRNGLCYVRARYYEPALGRFTTIDPLRFATPDPNLYRYAGNSPTNLIDPSGQLVLSWWVLIPAIQEFIQGLAPGLPPPTWPGLAGVMLSNLELIGERAGVVIDWTASTLELSWQGWQLIGEHCVDAIADASYGAAYWWYSREYPDIPSTPADSGSSAIVLSWDPNEKAAPLGYGENHAVSGDEKLRYVVYFENLPTATAPAQEIVITDGLDLDLDWATFELGEIAFGGQVVDSFAGSMGGAATVPLESSSLVVDIEAGIAAGTAHWALRAIDPLTGELPADPLAGLLPPNDPPDGRGEGHVTFSIYPKVALPSGTIITNSATIVFDTNPPISTDEVLNTVDSAPPASQVLALPAESASSFQISWQGEDDVGGSGIRDYTIYVSVDNTNYIPWLADTADAGAVFDGEVGHSYRFYSVARDNVGSIEAFPLTPDAVTTVTEIQTHELSVTASASPPTVASEGTTALGAVAADSMGHGIASWYWDDGFGGGSFSLSATVQNPTYTAPANMTDGNMEITLTVTAACDDTSPLSQSDSITLTVEPVVHSVSVTASPPGPGTIPSGGSASLSADLADSRSWHSAASWLWDDGAAGGTFSPSSEVQSPTYTAPANYTDSDLSVTLTVTATCDGPSPATHTDSTHLSVQPVPHEFSISASCIPETVASGGTASLSASFADSRSGHSVASWSWSDGGAGGTFSPSASDQNPTYTSPVNATDSNLLITLGVVAACNGAEPLSDHVSMILAVQPVPHVVTVTAYPPIPDTIPSRGTVALSADFSDSRSGHTVASWWWDDGGAGGTFSPSPNVPHPTWTAPGNYTGAPIQHVLTATASCDGSTSESGSAQVYATEEPCLYDLTFLPPFAEDSRRVFQRGSTIPIKFRLVDCEGNRVSDAVATVSLSYYDETAPPGEPEVVSTSAGDWGDQFRYDAEEDLYIFNLSTKRPEWLDWWTYEAVITLQNGQQFAQTFSLK